MHATKGEPLFGIKQGKRTVQFNSPLSGQVTKVNQDLMASVKKNLRDLQSLFDKTSKKIQINQKQAQSNFVNAQKIEDLLDGKKVDNSNACKKYPEAC